MRILLCLVATLAMLPAHADQLSEHDQLAWDAYQVAVAEAPGDIHGDLLLVKGMRLFQKRPRANPESDESRALAARAEVIAAELQARVDAVRDDNPVLLAGDLGCWPDAKSDTCRERRARLEAFAPDNAYFGMVLMTYAWLAEDAEAYQRAARLAASAQNYNSQHTNAFGVLRNRYRSVAYPVRAGATAQEQRMGPDLMAMGVAAAVAMPPLMHFSQPCRESEGELREHCLAVALKMMAQSQNLLEIYIAQSVVEALGSGEDIESAKMIRRDVDWLTERSFPLSAATEHGDVAGMQEYFDAYAADGELAAMRALLTVHNISLHPPEGWTKQ